MCIIKNFRNVFIKKNIDMCFIPQKYTCVLSRNLDMCFIKKFRHVFYQEICNGYIKKFKVLQCKLYMTQSSHTLLLSRHHFMTCVSITTPVLPTPALQWITTGDFLPLPSSDSANLCTDSISSRKPVMCI